MQSWQLRRARSAETTDDNEEQEPSEQGGVEESLAPQHFEGSRALTDFRGSIVSSCHAFRLLAFVGWVFKERNDE